MRLVPGIGTTSSGWANSQAKASCPGRQPLSAASSARAATGSRLVARLSAENRGLLARKSLESNVSPGFNTPVSGDRPNGLHGVCPADQVGPYLTESQRADLAGGDQFGHRPDGVFDRDRRIKPVAVVQ